MLNGTIVEYISRKKFNSNWHVIIKMLRKIIIRFLIGINTFYLTEIKLEY